MNDNNHCAWLSAALLLRKSFRESSEEMLKRLEEDAQKYDGLFCRERIHWLQKSKQLMDLML